MLCVSHPNHKSSHRFISPGTATDRWWSLDSLIILLLLYFTALDQGQNIYYTNKTRVGQARGGRSYLEHPACLSRISVSWTLLTRTRQSLTFMSQTWGKLNKHRDLQQSKGFCYLSNYCGLTTNTGGTLVHSVLCRPGQSGCLKLVTRASHGSNLWQRWRMLSS